MGQETSKILSDLSLTFMGTKPPTKQEILEFYYNYEGLFRGSDHARYNYFDEVVDKSDKVKEVLEKKRINWPSSHEVMVENRFFQNLTEE